MPTIVKDVDGYRADRPWGARDLLELDGSTTVRLHWTDSAYDWHVNDGEEAFVVLSGEVEMRYRDAGQEVAVLLGPSDIFLAHAGEAHSALPLGEARILVIERKGSA